MTNDNIINAGFNNQSNYGTVGVIQDIEFNNLDNTLSLEKIIAEQKELIVSLEKSLAASKKSISIMGHDLKNPLNSIFGFSGLLSDNFEELSKEEIKEYLGIIKNSSEGASDMIDNINILSKLQNNSNSVKPILVNVSTIVDKMYSLYGASLHNKSITLHSEISANDNLYIDENMITVALRNLIGNAIKFTPNGKDITITGYQLPNLMYKLDVIDTGDGMDKEKILKLSEYDSSLTTLGTNGEIGTGLGLKLVKEFVGLNNGKLEITSEQGKGSTFSMYLPMMPQTNYSTK